MWEENDLYMLMAEWGDDRGEGGEEYDLIGSSKRSIYVSIISILVFRISLIAPSFSFT